MQRTILALVVGLIVAYMVGLLLDVDPWATMIVAGMAMAIQLIIDGRRPVGG